MLLFETKIYCLSGVSTQDKQITAHGENTAFLGQFLPKRIFGPGTY